MNLSCTRLLAFDAGHRVVSHESKCAHLHGHRYQVEVTAQAEDHECDWEDTEGKGQCGALQCAAGLDELGRVIDFSVLKRLIGGWLDDRWDHGLILWVDDPLGPDLHRMRVGTTPDDVTIWQKAYFLPMNPTAENLAHHLLTKVCPEVLLGTGVRVTRVKLWETPNCYAVAEL